MTLEYYRCLGDLYRWRLIAKNGRIVAASSESFASRSGAKRNASATLQGLQKTLWGAKK